MLITYEGGGGVAPDGVEEPVPCGNQLGVVGGVGQGDVEEGGGGEGAECDFTVNRLDVVHLASLHVASMIGQGVRVNIWARDAMIKSKLLFTMSSWVEMEHAAVDYQAGGALD